MALSISPLSLEQAEGTTFTYTVTPVDTSVASTVTWRVTTTGIGTTLDLADPSDFVDSVDGVFPHGTVSFAAGDVSKQFTIDVAADTTTEPKEIFAVVVGSVGTSTQVAAFGIIDPATAVNQPPTIDLANSVVNGTISEAPLVTGSSTPDQSNGAIAFSDPNVSDRPTATITNQTVAYENSQGTAFTLSPTQVTSFEQAFSITPEANNTNNGKIDWNYSVPDSALDFLGVGEHLTITSTIQVDDHNGGTTSQDVTVTINGADDDPIANPDSAVVQKGSSVTVVVGQGVLANDTDPDIHDSLSVSAVGFGVNTVPVSATAPGVLNGAYGTLTLNSNGSYNYISKQNVPIAGGIAEDQFSYTVSDGRGGTANSILDVSVLGNSAPSATQTYTLLFDFHQSPGQDGRIQAGTLEATLRNNSTGESIAVPGLQSQPASVDDAFPILSTGPSGVPLPANPASVSPHITASGHPTIVFDIEDLAPGNPPNNALELHVGTVPNSGEFSWDSQGCLVVSQTNFLTPLEDELYMLDTGQPLSSPTSAMYRSQLQQLTSWINKNVSVDLVSDDALLTQTTLSVASGAGAFQFNISRPIEKDVMVLYTVKDENTSQLTTREGFVSADHTASSAIPVTSFLEPGRTTIGAPDANKLIQNTPRLSTLQGTYNAALDKSAPGDILTATIQGYEVKYQGGSQWYFDTQNPPGTSSNLQKENLMFGAPTSAQVHLAVTTS